MKILTVRVQLIHAKWWTDGHNKINGRLSRVCEGKHGNEAKQTKQEIKEQKTDMLRDSLPNIGEKGGPKILVYRTYVTAHHGGISPHCN